LSRESYRKVRRHIRLNASQLGQNVLELAGIAPSSAQQPVCPEIGSFAFVLTAADCKSLAGQFLYECKTKQERKDPELRDG
jgi:hypothetical protein